MCNSTAKHGGLHTSPDEHRHAPAPSCQCKDPMDPNTYQELCKRPDVLSRRTLELTRAVLRTVSASEAASISAILIGAPIEKPPKHTGGPESDYFKCDLTLQQLDQIVASLHDASRQRRKLLG